MAVGAAAPAATTFEQPRTPILARYAQLIAVVGGVVAAAAAGIAHVLAERSIPQPAGVQEATVAANAYGLTQLDGFQIPDSLSDRVITVHLALYAELTAAADRHATAAGTLREVLLVLVIAGALALFTLCRQLGLTTLTALGVVLLAYVAPAVVSAQVLVFTATIATTWLLVAAILLSARPSAIGLTWVIGALGVTLIALAAVISPVALLLPVGVLIVSLITRTLFPRWDVVRRGLVVGGFLGLLALAGVAALDTERVTTDSPIPQSTYIAVAVAGLVLAAVATWQVRWIRPLALGCVPLFIAALLPWGEQASAFVLGLPILAILFGAVVEETLTGLRRPGPIVARGMAGALVAAVAVGLLVLPTSATDAVDGAPATDLAAWLDTNTAAATRLQVDPLLWVELVRAGVPAERLQRTDATALGVSPAALVADLGGGDEDLPLIARFGEGTFAVDVRQRVPDAVSARTAILAERVAAQTFGAALAQNPNLSFDDAVEGDLTSGNVDSRLLTVLATAAADYTFTIDSFPPTNGVEEVGVLRTVRISDVTELDPASTTEDALVLRDFFRYQLLDYRPLSQGFDAGVLVVVYSAPSPVGLLS